MRDAAAAAGLELCGYGLDPLRPPRRLLDLPRYAAMEKFFDREGPWGRQMMCGTASVQVCLDAGDDSTGQSGYRARWRLLHAIGPVLVAAFANSPLRVGRPTGWRSGRQQVWANMDPGRTRAPALQAADGDPRDAWAAYALDAELMCVREPGSQDWTAPPGVTFRDWLRDGGSGPLRAPTAEDLDYHLSTLFPPVRPHGHMELRMIDAQPGDGWIVPAAVVTALTGDERAADAALAAAEPVWEGSPDAQEPWLRAARSGPSDARISQASKQCFDAAGAALARSGAPAPIRQAVSDFTERYVLKDRCPADDQLDGVLKMTESQLDPETLRGVIARELTGARQRTTLLTDSVDEADLVRQHSPLMSPLVWDLAHIVNQEELWLLREVGGRDPIHPEIDPLYDAFEHPRAERPTLPLLPAAEARAYGHEVRGRVLDLLDRAPFTGTRLLGDGFAFGMIAQHEVQHDETMLITHQIRAGAPVLAAASPGPAPADAFRLPSEVLVPGGPFTMGTSTEAWALDNERPAHTVDVAPFYLDTTPVTCGGYVQFIEDGGYDDPRWWTPAGWDHRQKAGLTAPLYWRAGRRPVDPPGLRPAGAGRAGRAGAARVLVRGGRVRPLGRAAAADRGRVGEGGPLRSRHRSDPQVPVGQRRAPVPAREPRPGILAPGAGRLLPRGGGAVRGQAADRGRLGVDELGLPAVPGVQGVAVPGVLGGVLRPGVQGAARRVVRGQPGGLPGHLPQLGLPDQAADLLRLPHRPLRRSRRPGDRLMCRHLAYVGMPATLRTLLIDPPHGLYRQAWAPRRQRFGTVNADGFGVGWYAPDDPAPARYRRPAPIWGDESFADIARVTRTGALLAAVRCATEGTDLGTAAVAPFASGSWLFSHNGKVEGWPDSVAELAATLPARALLGLEARVDSALLWALVRHRLELGVECSGAGPGGYRPGAARGGRDRPVQLAADQRPGDRGHCGGRHLVVPVWACGLVRDRRLGAR